MRYGGHYESPEALPDFVLVHGAYGDAATWAKIVPLLDAAGAKVTTLTLPAHPEADGALAAQTTLAEYVARVSDVVAAAEKPIVLAGHSLAVW